MQVELDSAESLLATFSRKKSKLLFRGERTVRELVPSAFRGPGQDYYHGKLRKDTVQEYAQIINELDVIYKLSSIRLPNLNKIDNPVTSILSNPFEKQRHASMKLFIEQVLPVWFPRFESSFEFIALAQHYGIPTRTIDWTPDLWTALQFAASGTLPHVTHSLELENFEQIRKDKMVIWEFDQDKFNVLKKDNIHLRLLKFGQPDYDINPNARAQQGHISYIEKSAPYNDPVDKTPLDQYLSNCGAPELLKQYLIPTIECVKILEYLDELGFTSKDLFPGEHGEVKAVNDSRNRDRFSRVFFEKRLKYPDLEQRLI